MIYDSVRYMKNDIFGMIIRDIRKNNDLGLREASRRGKFDSGNLSKLESGAIAPPNSRQKVEALCLRLGYECPEDLIDAAFEYHVSRLVRSFRKLNHSSQKRKRNSVSNKKELAEHLENALVSLIRAELTGYDPDDIQLKRTYCARKNRARHSLEAVAEMLLKERENKKL